MSIQLINDEDTLNTILAKSPPKKVVVVDFFAEWCGACTQLSPVFDRLSTTFKDSATFLKVNIDDCPSIAETFRISRLPIFVLAQGGREVDRCGASAVDLESKIAQWTSPNLSPTPPGITTAVNEKEFQGKGHRLGDTKTEVQELPGESESSTSSTAGNSVGWLSSVSNWFSYQKHGKTKEALAQEGMKIDTNLPQVPIQIRLVDSTKLKLTLNLTQPISKIREFIMLYRPEYATKRFILLSSFPRKEITDETISIGEAELGHAVVIQKLAK